MIRRLTTKEKKKVPYRNRYIMDEVMKRLWKKFPYRRVPTDVEAKLSETVHADKDNTPAAVMNK